MRRLLPILLFALCLAAPASSQSARNGAPVVQSVGPAEMPGGYLLEPVYPNPFASTAKVWFAATQAQRVDLALYDALGRRIRTLYTGPVEANVRFELQLDGRSLPNGLYLVRFAGDGFSTTRRVTLLR